LRRRLFEAVSLELLRSACAWERARSIWTPCWDRTRGG